MAMMRFRILSSSVPSRLWGPAAFQQRNLSFHLGSPLPAPRSFPAARAIPDFGSPFVWSFRRMFSADISNLPAFADPEIESAFKDLLAAGWDKLPESVVRNAKKAVSKNTEDKASQEALAGVFRAATASEEFGGTLVSLRMALDDLSGLTGESVGPLPGEIEEAMKSAYKRYTAYLDSFIEDEAFLRKKVEAELGTKMIHLKMRCSRIGSEWGKVTLIGTSGLAGSYVEQRA